MSYHEKTASVSKGKWRGILLTLGVPETALKNRHGPCPMCGGADRFRWDNVEGRGTYICTQCGAGDGMKLAMEFTKKPFAEVAALIDGMVGNIKPSDEPKREMSDEQVRAALREAFAQTIRVSPGDLVHRYLAWRGIDEVTYPQALRFGAAMRDGEGGVRPCMVAMVSGPDGKPATMHRTFLKPDGSDKAEMVAPRKLMPGPLVEGCCVRLSDYTGGPLGIAEGIETAMSASALFDVPVWAAINSAMLAKWMPPEGCYEIAIFGDNDPKYGGQKAAYHLAHRLSVAGKDVTVSLPLLAGQDWNDVLKSKRTNNV